MIVGNIGRLRYRRIVVNSVLLRLWRSTGSGEGPVTGSDPTATAFGRLSSAGEQQQPLEHHQGSICRRGSGQRLVRLQQRRRARRRTDDH